MTTTHPIDTITLTAHTIAKGIIGEEIEVASAKWTATQGAPLAEEFFRTFPWLRAFQRLAAVLPPMAHRSLGSFLGLILKETVRDLPESVMNASTKVIVANSIPHVLNGVSREVAKAIQSGGEIDDAAVNAEIYAGVNRVANLDLNIDPHARTGRLDLVLWSTELRNKYFRLVRDSEGKPLIRDGLYVSDEAELMIAIQRWNETHKPKTRTIKGARGKPTVIETEPAETFPLFPVTLEEAHNLTDGHESDETRRALKSVRDAMSNQKKDYVDSFGEHSSLVGRVFTAVIFAGVASPDRWIIRDYLNERDTVPRADMLAFCLDVEPRLHDNRMTDADLDGFVFLLQSYGKAELENRTEMMMMAQWVWGKVFGDRSNMPSSVRWAIRGATVAVGFLFGGGLVLSSLYVSIGVVSVLVFAWIHLMPDPAYWMAVTGWQPVTNRVAATIVYVLAALGVTVFMFLLRPIEKKARFLNSNGQEDFLTRTSYPIAAWFMFNAMLTGAMLLAGSAWLLRVYLFVQMLPGVLSYSLLAKFADDVRIDLVSRGWNLSAARTIRNWYVSVTTILIMAIAFWQGAWDYWLSYADAVLEVKVVDQKLVIDPPGKGYYLAEELMDADEIAAVMRELKGSEKSLLTVSKGYELHVPGFVVKDEEVSGTGGKVSYLILSYPPVMKEIDLLWHTGGISVPSGAMRGKTEAKEKPKPQVPSPPAAPQSAPRPQTTPVQPPPVAKVQAKKGQSRISPQKRKELCAGLSTPTARALGCPGR